MRQITEIKVDHPVVEAIGKMDFTGNIIPNAWFQTLRDKSGHPYMNAIVILADIRYWYTPTEVRDEESGRTIGFRKKFKADALQRSRDKFAEQFGLSLKQVDAALSYLQDCGIIHKEIRNDIINGKKIGNLMYIYLDANVLYRYTYPERFFVEESAEESCKESDEEVFPDEDMRCLSAEEEGISLQGERISPYRGRGYCPTGGEGIALQGERVLPCRGRGYLPTGEEGIALQGDTNTYNNTYIKTENNTYLHHPLPQNEEDEKIFAELCGNVKGMQMSEESRRALCACVRGHPTVNMDVLLLAAKFSSLTCLSKASLSRIRYLSAVLTTLEERGINTPDQFECFQQEWKKQQNKMKSQKNYTESFQREYDFDELEKKLLSND